MEKIETAPKNVLVDIVKRSQKQGMRGVNGSWKEFVNVSNKQLDNRLYDPAKWLPDALIEFLKTFNNASYLNYFAKVVERHEIVEAFKKSTDKLSPEQELFHKTVTHPHYATSYVLPSHKEGWVVIKNSKKLKEPECNTIYAVDCEMVLCDDGTDALVRVCVVDRDLKVKLDELVKPDKRIVDYRTRITGIRARDLEKVTMNLRGVQAFMLKLLSEGAILAGHSLDSDLRALKIDYTRVIDTSFIFNYSSGPIFRRASLNNLCKAVLGSQVRKDGDVHDCLDDTIYTMKLVVAKLNGKGA
ncbi:small RNA degrading nuclease 3-like [Bidens hawaiensis]|uniref:small RNA degrading nuclease 3-like n=1 Tax=Bidens hawaiensis TaxID=980011 RepID=UPI00404B7727